LSSIEIINHVNTALFNLLRESLREPLGPDLNITFGSPADEDGSGDNAPRLYVFLYNIIEDGFSKNRPDEFRGGARLFSFKPPLAVNLYYMLTPFSAPRSSTTADPPDRVQAHTMIALAMRAFYDNGLVNPKYFPANTTLGESQVRISSVQMNLEEITKIWSSFNKPFRLSMCYEVSIVQIQSEGKPKEIHLVDKAAARSEREFEVPPAIGKRNLSKLKDKGWWNLTTIGSDNMGAITDVRPFAVQPGMALSIYGRNFKNKKLIAMIDGRKIDDTSIRIIQENLIKVKIPPDVEPGIKKLSLKSDDEGQKEEVAATFEVLPVEPGSIKITEVRPDKGITGDLVTLYGINFNESARVSIGNIEVTKLSFVDNAQINIMIPPGLPSGTTTTLTVRTDQGTASKVFRVL
jgi:hypothetical protein